ncbi:MAG TPA: zinc ribbon domain-containing protein [Dissulfurispiraceae bacterium]|nr:zinc ribbon domain-containing protein [Dissulfurispiraceae bacterium]
MPLYEFQCQQCSMVFTVLRSAGCFDEVKCPSCESGFVLKRMSGFNACSPGCGSSNSGGFGRFGAGFGGG